ncbi:MAG: ATP-dependent helicase [Actinobacteria bacterium]|nr:ATP-dependent helicase [Actinomycetota bacterium]
MALPIPIGRQRDVLELPIEGNYAVLGTAGSGKTTLAILRAAYLADRQTDHAGRTLLVTFNNALVKYLRHLGQSELHGVSVETYHLFARGYLSHRGQLGRSDICGDRNARRALITQAVTAVASQYQPNGFFERPLDFFSEELRWLAQYGIRTQEQYEAAERVGRTTTRVQPGFRPVVWEIHEEYRRLREAKGWRYDWDDIAAAAATAFQEDAEERLYRHVVIDEGQDFSPEMLRSLARAVASGGSLTFFGDVAQQIYGQRLSWRSAGINLSAPVIEFTENYRNTREIARLALAISRMPFFVGDPDLVEPNEPAAEGLPRRVPDRPPKVSADIAGNTSRDELVSLRVGTEHRGELLVVNERRVSLAKRMNKHHSVRGTEAPRLDERGDGSVHELIAGVGYVFDSQSEIRAEEREPLPLALARRDVGLALDRRARRC